MRGAGYMRVSSQDQVDGTSLESQKAQIEAYAAMKGIELVAVWQDAGISGGVPIAERPEGAQLAAMIEMGEVEAVIIVKLDRAFRNTVDCLQSVELWEKASIALHIIDLGGNSVDTTSPAGRFMLTVLAAASEMEKGMIRDRCNAGRKIRKAQGCRIGGTPFGYAVADDGKTLVPDVQEQEIIALCLELQSQGLSTRRIAAELNDRGILTKKGKAWTHVQVFKTLKRAA